MLTVQVMSLPLNENPVEAGPDHEPLPCVHSCEPPPPSTHEPIQWVMPPLADMLIGRPQPLPVLVPLPLLVAMPTMNLPQSTLLKLPLTVTPTVRERYAFTCDIGRPVAELRLDFPHVVLDHIDEIWWPPVEEPAEQVIDRAQLFRAEMAALAE